MESPLRSGYPGTPFMLIAAGVGVFLIVRSTLRIRKINLKGPTTQQDILKEVMQRGVGVLFLVVAFLVIWGHYHFSDLR